MKCDNCGKKLPNKTGFVVCQYCKTINHIADIDLPITRRKNQNTGSRISSRLSFRLIRENKLKKEHIIIGGAVSLLIIISLVCIGFYQNNRTHALLKNANIQISNGKYQTALDILKKARKYYSTGETKRQVNLRYLSDSTWVTDENYYLTATRLINDNLYDRAAVIIAQISNDFPGKSKVESLTRVIKEHNASVEAKAAAQVAADLAAQALADKAASIKPVKNLNGKRFAGTTAVVALANAKTIDSAEQILQSFVSQYSLIMEIKTVKPSSYVTLYDTYSTLSESDLSSLKTYGSLFIDEWSKYPLSWIVSSKLNYIVLVKDLAVVGTHRSATVDPIGEAMYYDVSFNGDYAREVVHHEFSHLFTYNYFNSYSPNDPDWQGYNPAGFSYGNGGASCYLPANSCLTGEHPILGFATGYATSAIEEDKAELYAYLMTGIYYHHLTGWLPGDSALTAKVDNLKRFIVMHSPEMTGNYFSDINP